MKHESFYPEWDGIMVSDKQKLRDALLNDLIIKNDERD